MRRYTFNCGRDNCFGQSRGFAEQWMHGGNGAFLTGGSRGKGDLKENQSLCFLRFLLLDVRGLSEKEFLY